ncbi:MAG: RNA methyltransferase [gamma proteobacterium symbiont of Stewartia floridana]|uniref:HypC/HybG/HupF family hydrogenase formation chaperone n=1 Tax=Candidatus Thiodiazotropha taylori TaxID=2792791 RepID=A0A9E4KBI5_9GAMM|nr:HypC/HybG/HupF family hydrogenase formation chaperone [Candidatus Thiodiazotropha taylori]MBW9258342.1 HypC/HybG/HupF family hydrogenase formation chaperone [Candidatus Thiodiazotropha sp. (ex. Lucinisca nassula)]MCG8018578.1 HypC/HybG/HupF family hydrogenase formation chaperone [Candidatus Thiodiazotropha sp. 'RUGA']RLW51811.1 MAG: RNA methyltransferase [gamma proteobacterium symbiont of Stewartia floridana]MBV2121490.1 HypC/HybG/HupF family hydrogenase formation chaperone [Candidatus Thiod
MCIGIPMQVVSTEGTTALCQGMGESRRVDTLLVGDQPVGSWLLVFLNSAREVLSEQRAEQISQALQALDLALSGESEVDHLFADLVDRTPELPEHLRPKQ